MKKLLIIALLCVGCSDIDEVVEKQYEGCTYIRFSKRESYPVFVHKGNCPNPIHHDTCKCK